MCARKDNSCNQMAMTDQELKNTTQQNGGFEMDTPRVEPSGVCGDCPGCGAPMMVRSPPEKVWCRKCGDPFVVMTHD